MKPCDDQCACGIARIDCDYHAPEKKPVVANKRAHAFILRGGSWELLLPWELPWEGKFITADGLYIHTFSRGQLIDEEPT